MQIPVVKSQREPAVVGKNVAILTVFSSRVKRPPAISVKAGVEMIVGLRERRVIGVVDFGAQRRIDGAAGEHAPLQIGVGLREIVEPGRDVETVEEPARIAQLVAELMLVENV